MTAIHAIVAGSSSGSASELTVTIDPLSTLVSFQNTPLFTPIVTASATGGSGTYTYAWTRVSSSSASAAATSPIAAATSFSCEVAPFDTEDATFRCTVTDVSSPHATGFKNIYVQFYRI